MFKISDRVKESSITTGTGAVVLSGPYGGFQSFSNGIGDGNTTFYAIENGVQWEVGEGVYTQSTNSLSRDRVFDSSSGGALISLDGVSVVFCTLPASQVSIEDDGQIVSSGVFAESGVINLLYSDNVIISNDLSASGDGYFGGDLQLEGNLNVGGETTVSGDTYLIGDVSTSGFLTLVRPNSAGNFFHAYKNDSSQRTISLHVDSNSDPVWKLGAKGGPGSETTPPSVAYVYGKYSTTNPIVGILADNDNYLQIDPTFGVTVNHQGTNVVTIKDTGVSITPSFNSHGLVITPNPLGTENLQEWRNSSDTPLTIVDSGGRIGVLTGDVTLDYNLDVKSSGRIETLQVVSGIYFNDGTFQPTAASDAVAIEISGYFQDYVDNQENAESGWAGATIANTGAAVSGWTRDITFFTEDLTVSLPNGKTFGKYETGTTIPASGKTPKQVIEMAIVEAINPTVSLTSSSSVDFNETAVSNTLNFSHTINSLGATVATASLEFRRGNTGAWSVISSSTSTPSSFVHSFTDTAYNTDVMNYRYVVTDTAGGTATATKDIQPDTYSNPSVSISVVATSATSPETNTSREKGNVSSTIYSTVTRNETYVDLQSYEIQYSLNNGAYQVIDSGTIGPGNSVITPFLHNPVADNTADSIRYRIKVIDQYLDSIGSQRYSSVNTTNYNYLIYFGSESSAATTSNDVRGLSNKRFPSAGDTFDFNTGNTLRFFNVAIPDGETISSVIDLDALNANITSSYINNPFNVQDFGGNNKLYNVYTMEVAVPYSSSHTHRITKG